MPHYDYKCETHGYFELQRRMADHASGACPDCGTVCKQVVLTAPSLDTEAMANIGMPGAFSLSGDRLEKRHIQAGQSYVHPEKAKKHGSVHRSSGAD